MRNLILFFKHAVQAQRRISVPPCQLLKQWLAAAELEAAAVQQRMIVQFKMDRLGERRRFVPEPSTASQPVDCFFDRSSIQREGPNHLTSGSTQHQRQIRNPQSQPDLTGQLTGECAAAAVPDKLV